MKNYSKHINGKRLKGKMLSAVFLIIILLYSFSCSITVSAETEDEKIRVYETVFANDKAKIDFTDSDDTGTVKVNIAAKFDKKIKVTVAKTDENSTVYTYDLKNDATAEIYPLQMGDGEYIVKVWYQIEGIRYYLGASGIYSVRLSDKHNPFLHPHQYVNYSKDSKTAEIARELTKNCRTSLEKAEAIYNFIIHSIKYDEHKASTVQSGYIPAVDEIIDAGKGICFDYAVLFAAMLRSVNIPAKLVIGDMGHSNIYHAWNEFYLDDGGGEFKITGMKFSGGKFERADPTSDPTAKTGRRSKQFLQFVANDENYKTLLVY